MPVRNSTRKLVPTSTTAFVFRIGLLPYSELVELYLEIVDGNAKGDRIPFRNGLTIGRKDCDLNIEDPKVSSKHARVEQRRDGSFWLIDLGSSNGIRAGNAKLTELALDPGISFRLGRTNLKVSGKKVSSEWRESIMTLTERAIKEAALPKTKDVVALERPLKFKFTRGLQAGQEWVIGYGPREVGTSSVDLPLFEPGLPGKCFQLLPKDLDVILRVHEDASRKILLNGKVIESAFLRNGDVLDIGNTRIEISYDV